MAYIYKITNLQNGKVYIGKTSYTVEHRYKEHCYDYTKRDYEKRPLYSAMKKYGLENFKVEEIEQCSEDIASEREIYWIKQHDSFHNGYNATMGGDGKTLVDYEKIYNLWKQGLLIKEIEEITGHTQPAIKNVLEKYGVTNQDRKERSDLKKGKPVVMIDKKTDQKLKEFAHATQAAEFLGDKSYRRHIAEVCKGKRKTAYGYKWEYIQSPVVELADT